MATQSVLRPLEQRNPNLQIPTSKISKMAGRVFSVQTLKSSVSFVALATLTKYAIDSSINLSRYAGHFWLSFPEKILALPLASFLSDSVSDRTALILDSARVHALAALRIGICVSGAISLYTLLGARKETSSLFFTLGVIYYGGVTVDYAFRSCDSLAELYSSNASSFTLKESGMKFLAALLGLEWSKKGCELEEILKVVDKFNSIESNFSQSSSPLRKFFYQRIVPIFLSLIEGISDQKHSKNILARCSFPSYVAAISSGKIFWMHDAEDLKSVKQLSLDALEKRVNAFKKDEENAEEHFTDIRESLGILIADQRNDDNALQNKYLSLYAVYSNLNFTPLNTLEELNHLTPGERVEAAEKLFSHMSEFELEEMNRIAIDFFLKRSSLTMLGIMNLNMIMEQKMPLSLRGIGEEKSYLMFPGQRMEVVNNGGQMGYQHEVVSDFLKNRFQLTNEAWATPFQVVETAEGEEESDVDHQDPQVMISTLLLGRANEGLCAYDSGMIKVDGKEYKPELKAHIEAVLSNQKITTYAEFIHYVYAEKARLDAFYKVFNPYLSDTQNADNIILGGDNKWDYLSFLNMLFKDGSHPKGVIRNDQDFYAYRDQLVKELQTTATENSLTFYEAWMEYFKANIKIVQKGKPFSYSSIPPIRASTSSSAKRDLIPSISISYFRDRSIKILNVAKNMLLPALELTGVVAGLFDGRAFMRVALIWGLFTNRSFQMFGNRSSFTYIGGLQRNDATDIRSMVRGSWNFAESALWPSIWNVMGTHASAYYLGQGIRSGVLIVN